MLIAALWKALKQHSTATPSLCAERNDFEHSGSDLASRHRPVTLSHRGGGSFAYILDRKAILTQRDVARSRDTKTNDPQQVAALPGVTTPSQRRTCPPPAPFSSPAAPWVHFAVDAGLPAGAPTP